MHLIAITLTHFKICKVMDTVLKGAILNHLQHTAPLSGAQHLTNFLTAEELVYKLIDAERIG